MFTPAQIKELTGRAQRAQTDRQKHLDALADVGAQADKLEEETPPLPDTLMRDPLLWGGIAGGLAIDGVSFLMKAPLLAVVGLVPYFGSLLAALRWIDAHEAAEGTEAQIKRLREREEQMKKTFAEDQAPLKAALKTAKVESPEELVELFKHRDEQLRLRDQAAERLARLREEPELAAIAEERPRLMEEKQVLELTVASQGFARGVSEIENDLKRELGLTAPEPAKDQKKNTADDGSDAKKLFERAAELLGTTPAELMTAVAPRLSAYLTALTDKKLASAKMDPAGMVFLLAADGRGGPYATAPQPMKDQGYLAMRLALLERVIGAKKMPVFIDDTFASVDAAKKPLLAKMLKGLAQQTQVLHRVPEAPVAGVFDAVVQAPA
ncbi:MAG: hypothetical protein JST92_06270 [Deltaproteobacteria bacterium]|nr:hypothetical protein [Deltaproteobacteria bacterium]